MVFLSRSSLFSIMTLVVCFSFLSGCDRGDLKKQLSDKHDTDLALSREDYTDNLFGKHERSTDETTPPPAIPDVSDILAAPPAPEKTGVNKLISLSVTEDVPLKDVLLELGRLADTEMEIDASISGGIILRVKNRPFDDVIRRIADLGSLRYSYENGVLRVERDTVYVKNYTVDFLNLIRSNSGSVTINTQVLGGASSASSGDGGGSSSGGLSSGSTNAISTSYEGDLWASVEQSITDILNFQPSDLSAAINDGSAAASSNATASPGFTMNRQAGVISVRATEKQHRNVAEYLAQVKKVSSAQVLIEAKIVEVNLNDEYRSGVNWDLVNSKSDVAADFDFRSSFPTETVTDFLTLSLGNTADLTTTVQLVEQFGTTRIISSPRLHAINNQQAVLTFAENDVYFTLEVEREEDTDGSGVTDVTSTVSSTLNTVPIGVILSLQPSIDLDNEEITMNIRPTLSRITERRDDPGVTLSARQIEEDSTITSSVPVIEVREMDSVLKIKSGEVMVIGGLMEERSANKDVGIPGLSGIPILGNAFKSVEKTTDVVETVIFIKATIVGSRGYVGKADRNFYKTFTREPRPLTF